MVRCSAVAHLPLQSIVLTEATSICASDETVLPALPRPRHCSLQVSCNCGVSDARVPEKPGTDAKAAGSGLVAGETKSLSSSLQLLHNPSINLLSTRSSFIANSALHNIAVLFPRIVIVSEAPLIIVGDKRFGQSWTERDICRVL